MDLPHGITVTVERAPGTDRHGNPLGGATTHTVTPCGVAPAGSTERIHLEATVEWDLDLIVPYAANIRAEDVITLPGDTTRYQVQGRPSKFRSPFTGWEAGAIARLKGVGKAS
jgi:hypothetical protein